jgi:hypothetical protein
MHPQRVESLSHAQRERLAYIDFRLYFFGEIGRPDLASASVWLRQGRRATWRCTGKSRRRTSSSTAATRSTASARRSPRCSNTRRSACLSALALGLRRWSERRLAAAAAVRVAHRPEQPQDGCAGPGLPGDPRQAPVAIRYHSMSSGESERVIVPFALVDTGLRWHVRAFDRKSGEFRDFVVTRIEAPTLVDEEPKANERPDNDIQWTRIVELDLVPHPRLARPEIIKMDYGMTDGSIRMRVRAAVAGYMLLRWSVDARPTTASKKNSTALWLSDPLALVRRRERKARARLPRPGIALGILR